MKPNCFECSYQRDVPGSANIACHHPSFKDFHNNPMMEIMGIFAGVGRVPPVQLHTDGIKVVGDPHGIKNGWFNHPLSFDPTWLEECNGFKGVEKELQK